MNKAKVFGRIGLSTAFATLIVIVFYGLATTRPVVHARAQDENATTGCTLATIEGNYGVLATGTAPGYSTRTGIFTLYGTGKFMDDYTQSYNGAITSGTFSGTYTLGSSCSVKIKLPYKGYIYTYAGVVVTNGNEIDLISTTPSTNEAWVLKKIS